MDPEVHQALEDLGRDLRGEIHDTRQELGGRIEATEGRLRHEFREAIEASAAETRGALREDVQATAMEARHDLRGFVDQGLAALREHVDRGDAQTRRHMGVLVEALRGDVRGVADGMLALGRKLDRSQALTEERLPRLETRVTRLEAERRRRRR